MFAGYAKSATSTEMPAGVLRAKALVAATSPLATMDEDGEFDLVPSAPTAQMMTDTEGSIFLISYSIDAIELLAVDGVNPKWSDLASQLKDGNVEAVASASGDAFTYLGLTDRSGSLSQGTIDKILGTLSDLSTRLVETNEYRGDVAVRRRVDAREPGQRSAERGAGAGGPHPEFSERERKQC